MAVVIYSFPPVIGTEAHLLILGSMPSQRSLEMGQYYAHPRNLFWRISGSLLGFDPLLPYTLRLEKLKEARIALWDSLKACVREGSLDQKILIESEEPNDLAELLAANPTIRAIAFNGGKSWGSFKKFILPNLSDETRRTLALLPMPSTSPANARVALEDKLQRWGLILQYLQ
jgi:TDG/mug DNA glycosylase family protein